MRLQDYSSFFRPEEFDAMTAAYDAAWQHMRTHRPTAHCRSGSGPKKEPSADYSSVRLHGATGLGAAKRDCIARRLRATAPRLGLLVSQLLPSALLVT